MLIKKNVYTENLGTIHYLNISRCEDIYTLGIMFKLIVSYIIMITKYMHYN